MLQFEDDEKDYAIFKVSFAPDDATVSFLYQMDENTPEEYVQEYLTLIHGIVAAVTTDTDYLYKLGEMVNFGRALMHREKQDQDYDNAEIDSADLSNVTFHPSFTKKVH